MPAKPAQPGSSRAVNICFNTQHTYDSFSFFFLNSSTIFVLSNELPLLIIHPSLLSLTYIQGKKDKGGRGKLDKKDKKDDSDENEGDAEQMVYKT